MTTEAPARPARPIDEQPYRVEILDRPAGGWVGNAVRHKWPGEAWQAGSELLNRWFGATDFRVMREGVEYPIMVYSCLGCRETGMHPSHAGSKGCESGSLASGGSNTHCACSACFG